MTADKSRDVDADSSVCNVCCLGVCRGQVDVSLSPLAFAPRGVCCRPDCRRISRIRAVTTITICHGRRFPLEFPCARRTSSVLITYRAQLAPAPRKIAQEQKRKKNFGVFSQRCNGRCRARFDDARPVAIRIG
jgi:hypothetical protein